MKHYVVATISFLCLGVSLSAGLSGLHATVQNHQDSIVASEYNPPGRGNPYRGGTRMIDQPDHRNVV